MGQHLRVRLVLLVAWLSLLNRPVTAAGAKPGPVCGFFIKMGPLPVVAPTAVAKTIKMYAKPLPSTMYSDGELMTYLNLTQVEVDGVRKQERLDLDLKLAAAWPGVLAGNLEAIGSVKSWLETGQLKDELSLDMRVLSNLTGPRTPFIASALLPRVIQSFGVLAGWLCGGQGFFAPLAAKLDEGQALLRLISGVATAIGGMHNAIHGCQKVPVKAVSKPADVCDKAIHLWAERTEGILDKVNTALGESCGKVNKNSNIFQKAGQKLNAFLSLPPVKCFAHILNKYMFLMSVMDVVCTSTTYQLTLNQDHWFRDKEAAACVVRPKAPPANKTLTRNITIAPGCTPKVTGRRLLWAEGGDAAQSPFHGQVVTLDMLPAADFMHEPRMLYEQWSTDGGASNGSALGTGRRLQQTGGKDFLTATSEVGDKFYGFRDVSLGVLQAHIKMEEAVRALQVDKVFDFIKEVGKIKDAITPAFEPLKVIGDIFSGIAEVLQYIKCPEFLGFICKIQDLIMDLVNEIVKGITGLSLDDWIQEILEALGLDKLLDDLAKLLPNMDWLENGITAIVSVVEEAEAQLTSFTDELSKLKSYFMLGQFDLTDTILAGSEEVVRAGVVRKYAKADGGAPVTFTCPATAYPVVFEASRIVWKCTQTLSAFMRFPCNGKPPMGTSSCSVDYNATWLTDCTDPEYNQAPNPDALDELRSFMGVERLDQEDRFRSTYYCVDTNIDFRVLSELFDGAADTDSKQTSTWSNTGQNRYSSNPKLKVGTTIIPTITCNAGRSIFIESYSAPPNFGDGKQWSPCYYRPYMDADTTGYVRELCWWKLSDYEGRSAPFGLSYDDTDDRFNDKYRNLKGTFTCSGDASGVYALIGYTGWGSSSPSMGSYQSNFAACLAQANWVQDNKKCQDYDACEGWPCAENLCGFGCNCAKIECGPQNTDKVTSFPGGTFLYPSDVCDQDYPIFGGEAKTSRTTAKAARISTVATYDAAPDVFNNCSATVQACSGATSCDLKGCVPSVMQWSCMEPAFFDDGATRLVYVFGDSKRTRTAAATCPAGFNLRLRTAEYGEAVSFQDVTLEVASTMCSGTSGTISCWLDITQFPDYPGKILRVEWECECGAGSKASRGENGTCSPCPQGTMRSAFMTDCRQCDPGSYQPDQGKTECLVCPAGSYSTTAGASNCTMAPPGYYSPQGGTEALPSAVNTYAAGTGSPACTDCPLGTFNSGEASSMCTNCTAGTYRGAGMLNCTKCAPGYFAIGSASACQQCPPGSYAVAPGSAQCTLCPVGTYQPLAGQQLCNLCSGSTYTAAAGATSASACSLESKPVDYDAVAAQLAANLTQSNNNTLVGRHLLQSTNGTGTLSPLCRALLHMYNASEDEVGNGLCNYGPYNTAACNYDGGDCCENTCVPVENGTMGFSCAPQALACRDPAALARAAAQFSANPAACIPKGVAELTPEPNGTVPCPVASNDARIGNSLCDDDLNIKACGYDGGDCCSTTCRPSRLVQGACAPSQFNCRNKTAALDLLPPTIIAPAAFTRTITWLNDSANPNLPLEAAAYDNFPCFVSKIIVSDVKTSDVDCARGVFYAFRRTYTATDRAGNVGRASAVVTILDDVPPRLAGVPQPANVTWNSTFVRGGGMANATRVTASDNSPKCFSNQVTYREQILDLPRQCSSRVAYHLRRTWNTMDGAGNVARAEQLVTVMDVEIIAFNAATLSMARTSSTSYTLRVPDPLPFKQYTWIVTQYNTNTPLQKIKTGTAVTFTFSATTARQADFVITTGRVLDFRITVRMDATGNCSGAFNTTQTVMTLKINVT